MKPTSTSSATVKEWTAIVLLDCGIIMAFIALTTLTAILSALGFTVG